ncbi:MAG: protein meaA [Ferrimicrobium sp.]
MSYRLNPPDRPWVMRTYSGHSSARASNALYRANLAKGQTGLSVAFDLPTQLGYDPDSPRARGEVGKVGVPVAHIGHMRELFHGLPLDEMNTSMTINATAAWLFSLYLAVAEEEGIPTYALAGTTQNDIVKEYLSRGTFIFPPQASRRLTVDLIVYAVANVPRWNPINICSYHLQEAGATPTQEIAYALATAVGVLDAVRDSDQVDETNFPEVVGRISFFVNAGMRIVEETAKMRAFCEMWDRICLDRYHIKDPLLRRFRYGVQVNSLGLTESQPENNVYRIMLEALSVTLSRGARARALQLPAWNEAIGLPRPFDQQWSLRAQQILAFETDILEYEDIFDGSTVIAQLTGDIIVSAKTELDRILAAGGVFEQVEELKSALVAAQAARAHAIETGEQVVVGVNRFQEAEAAGFGASGETMHLVVDSEVEAALITDLTAWRDGRSQTQVASALKALESAARVGENLIPASIALARAGGTTQEWADTLREIFGEYRAPTGIRGGFGYRQSHLAELSRRVDRLSGGRPRLLVAKPGMDGHSNGAEQIAIAARDAGFEVIYQGIRQTPLEIALVARDEDVEIVGLSILSGSHLTLVPEVISALHDHGIEVPVVVGGIIPVADVDTLLRGGVSRVYTPSDYRMEAIMADLVDLVTSIRES